MKEAWYPDGGITLVEETWQEQAAKTYCALMHNLSMAGIHVYEVAETDIAAAETKFDNLQVAISAWMNSAVVAAQAGEPVSAFDYNAIPDLIELLALVVTGQWGLIFALFVKVGLKAILQWLKEKLPADSNVEEVSAKIDEIFLDRTDPAIVGNRLADLLNTLQIAVGKTINIEGVPAYSVGAVSDEDQEY